MLIHQKDNITIDLVKQEQGLGEYRLDITLQINGKLKRTGMFIFKRIPPPNEGTGACGRYNEIYNLTELETVLNILIDLGYEIGEKNEILSIINQQLQD